MAGAAGRFTVRSPGGKDANDSLQSGHLGGFWRRCADAATGMSEFERPLWALGCCIAGWDRCRIGGGAQELAARLGRVAPVEPEPGWWVQAVLNAWGSVAVMQSTLTLGGQLLSEGRLPPCDKVGATPYRMPARGSGPIGSHTGRHGQSATTILAQF